MHGKEGPAPSSVPSEISKLIRSLSSTASMGLLFTGVCTPLFVAKLLLCDPSGIACTMHARDLDHITLVGSVSSTRGRTA